MSFKEALTVQDSIVHNHWMNGDWNDQAIIIQEETHQSMKLSSLSAAALLAATEGLAEGIQTIDENTRRQRISPLRLRAPGSTKCRCGAIISINKSTCLTCSYQAEILSLRQSDQHLVGAKLISTPPGKSIFLLRLRFPSSEKVKYLTVTVRNPDDPNDTERPTLFTNMELDPSMYCRTVAIQLGPWDAFDEHLTVNTYASQLQYGSKDWTESVWGMDTTTIKVASREQKTAGPVEISAPQEASNGPERPAESQDTTDSPVK